MQKVTVTTRKFTKPADFSPEKFYAKSFGAFVGSGDHRVVIRFDAEVAPQIRERFWHESQETKELPGGGLELRLHLSSLDEIRRWVLGWADAAEVISPSELRTSIKAAAKATAGQY